MAISATAREFMPFSSKFFDINGHRMHYIDEGEGDVIFLVHGNPTWSFYYRNLIKDLSQNYRVIAIDHIGCGASDKPHDHPYTLEQRIKDFTALVNFIGSEKYSLVVHDWGGAIGFGHAVENAYRINKIVITNTAAFRSDRIPFTINLCRLKFFGPFIVKYLNAFCFPATFMTTTRKLPSKIKKAYLEPYNSIKKRRAISEFVLDIPLGPGHPSFVKITQIENKLKQLQCPKLILWGGRDFCFNDSFYEKWREIYPNAKYKYYKNAGHYLLEDETEDASYQISQFLGEC